jgi:acyl-[acyl-carrier-protein]-phospholipid O-acyltransferase/long-chain-fatty-acid--[acyl-carrier-protein] ligase
MEISKDKNGNLVVTGLPDEKKGEKLVVLYEEELSLGLGGCDKIIEFVSKANIPNLWKPNKNNWIEIKKVPILGTGKLDLCAVKKLAIEKTKEQ